MRRRSQCVSRADCGRQAAFGRARRKVLAGLGAALTLAILGCGRRRSARLSPTGASTTAPIIVPTDVPRATEPSVPPMFLPRPTSAGVASPQVTVIREPSPPSVAQPADLVLLNGKVITVDERDTITQAVAIKDGLVLAVGTNDLVRRHASDKTQVMDLKGKAVTPGLVDPHNHLQVVGMTQRFLTPFMPPEVRTLGELQANLKAVAAKTAKGQWIQGYYLAVEEKRMPNRQDLDGATREHPIWLMQLGGHYGSANSLALKIAGIGAATKDPVGGVIERDAKGEPTGVFYNHRAMDMLRRAAPQQPASEAVNNIAASQAMFAAWGVTSYEDNNVRGVENVAAYAEVARQGKAVLRGAAYYTLEWPQDLDRALKEVQRFGLDKMRFGGYKFLIDGQAAMAFCHQPHAGVRWDVSTWEAKSFKQAVRALHETGLQICVHCVGDAAVDLTLDAYAEAMQASPRADPRHRIEHGILSTPDATRRMKDLGVVVSTQPTFLRVGGDYYPTLFGAERAKRILVTREWLDQGVHLALGSDAPTTPWFSPQVTLACAVGRPTPSERTFGPEQCLTIQEALRAHTLGAAYAAHEEKVKGSIEVGKLADLAVWNEDPYSVPWRRLAQVTIAMTLIGGQVVYQA